MGKTSDYYKSHPEAAELHRAYMRKYNKTEKHKNYRAELNKFNREHKDPKGNKTDASHGRDGSLQYQKQSLNRAFNGCGKRSKFSR